MMTYVTNFGIACRHHDSASQKFSTQPGSDFELFSACELLPSTISIAWAHKV
jgi:hypothetical protein